jgi:hypothetical protein
MLPPDPLDQLVELDRCSVAVGARAGGKSEFNLP